MTISKTDLPSFNISPTNLLPTGLTHVLQLQIDDNQISTADLEDVNRTLIIGDPQGGLTLASAPVKIVLQILNSAETDLFSALRLDRFQTADEDGETPKLHESGPDSEAIFEPFFAFGPEGDQGVPVETFVDRSKVTGDGVAIGIIDAGIAFWNETFRTQNSSLRFKSVTGVNLTLDRAPTFKTISGPTANTDEKSELEQLVDLSVGSGGQAAVIKKLAEKFPASVFAQGPDEYQFFAENRVSHGTCMAEMVLSTAPNDVPIHAMELPTAVLRDLSGGLLSEIIEVCVNELVNIVAKEENGKPAKMVVLLAYGILGGPHRGSAEIIDRLEARLAALNMNIELIVPMGNHRQDQCFAELSAGDEVEWHIQPNDFSANTLEVVFDIDGACDDENQPSFTLTAPDGCAVTIKTPCLTEDEAAADTHDLCILDKDDKRFGAVWTQRLDNGMCRVRIALAPTASKTKDQPTAAYGVWSLKRNAGSTFQVWVMRDETGFENDPREVFRSSWLQDDAYRRYGSFGLPEMSDGYNPKSKVKRAGTASLLSTSCPKSNFITAVCAKDLYPDDVECLAAYSGQRQSGTEGDASSNLSESAAPEHRPLGHNGRRAVLGNGSNRRFRVNGTSLAAALYAGKRA